MESAAPVTEDRTIINDCDPADILNQRMTGTTDDEYQEELSRMEAEGAPCKHQDDNTLPILTAEQLEEKAVRADLLLEDAVIEMDGNIFCAKLPSFINLAESPSGFGATRVAALKHLAEAMKMHAYQDSPSPSISESTPPSAPALVTRIQDLETALQTRRRVIKEVERDGDLVKYFKNTLILEGRIQGLREAQKLSR